VQLLPNVAWGELRSRVLHLEALGIDAVALADHFVDWTNPASPWFETWSLLPALAEATSTIRLTTVVTQIPLRHPAMLARQALTLDHISNGRIEIGLGTGLTIDPSYRMAGVPNWSTGERVARFAEYVELVGKLLEQEITGYEGRFYAVDGAVMNPRPVQQPRPPILVAALGPRMLELAVRHADIWNSLSFLKSFDEQIAETRERVRQVDELCERIGRDPASLQRSYTMFDANARPKGGELEYYESVERFAEQVGRVIDLGITDIGIYYPLIPSQKPAFERIASDVIPEIKRRRQTA
jgi:alkanesulfonate monooxygenase SsuD/methylene tetrahydromethanopterin reductase-like flavin-dependent oxidoreductase (luciferase family)